MCNLSQSLFSSTQAQVAVAVVNSLDRLVPVCRVSDPTLLSSVTAAVPATITPTSTVFG